MRTRTLADSVARWSLLLLFFLAPFFVIPAAWPTVAQSKILLAVVLLTIALVAWAIARLVEGALHIPRSFLLYVAPLLPLAYVLSALGSHAPLESYVSGDGFLDTVAAITLLVGLLIMFALELSGVGAAERRLKLHGTLIALISGIGVVLVFQAARLVLPSFLTLGGLMQGAASSVVGSWHDLGVLCALALVFCVALFGAQGFERGYRRLLLVLSGLAAFALLLVVNAPDVWFVLAAVTFLLAVGKWRSAERAARAKAALVPLVVAALALGAGFGGATLYAHLPTSLQIAQSEVRPSWQGTWNVGEQVFRGRGLIFGTGPNTFTRAWRQFKPAGSTRRNTGAPILKQASA